MKRKRRKPRGGADDPKYLALVRKLPCCFELGCNGHIEAHHRTGMGLALKAPDNETMPLCRLHHACLHAFQGPFQEMNRDQRMQWQLAMIDETREKVRKLREGR
jgi:hypothetical protein